MSESQVVSSCIKWLWLNGCFVWRNNTGMLRDKSDRPVRFGKTGSADIIGLNPYGRFLSIECKFGKGKLSDHQEAFGITVKEHHGIYIVAYSVDDLEAHKAEILAKIYEPALAAGALRDYRVRSTAHTEEAGL